MCYVFFFSSRRRHTRFDCDWSSDVCSSDLSSQFDAREFEGLHRYLRDSFPKSHAALKLTRVNGYGLLYEWTGSDPGLAPAVLPAHQEVAPIEPGTVGRSTEPPGRGRPAAGYAGGGGAPGEKGWPRGVRLA